jgi:peptidoglycan/xylan/chitin deacetylase (PgdA/CDA1 family)
MPPFEYMSYHELESRRKERERQRRLRARRRRLFAFGALVAVLIAGGAIALAAGTGGSGPKQASRSGAGLGARRARHHARHRSGATGSGSVAVQRGTGVPGTARVPILMYHVINAPPAGAPFPGLYVPADEFTAQMRALKDAGWHAVTLDQLKANWTRGVPLGPGKPIVLTFDNGYESQYANALPVLKQLGWVADENIQLTGLPPSQGGMTDAQVRGLIAAGWELDTQGISHADLVTLDAAQLHYQVATARQILRSRYGVPVEWFCYPSGHYNATVIDAVHAAGFVGSTTVVPGWASPQSDPYRLPRLRVLGGTSPSELLAQISSAESNPAPPATYTGG